MDIKLAKAAPSDAGQPRRRPRRTHEAETRTPISATALWLSLIWMLIAHKKYPQKTKNIQIALIPNKLKVKDLLLSY